MLIASQERFAIPLSIRLVYLLLITGVYSALVRFASGCTLHDVGSTFRGSNSRT